MMIVSNGEATTDLVAAAAVASPYWLPHLQSTSAVFGALVPILGGIWLFVQIVRALILGWVAFSNWRGKRSPKRYPT